MSTLSEIRTALPGLTTEELRAVDAALESNSAHAKSAFFTMTLMASGPKTIRLRLRRKRLR
jgi:hypothetical protein